VSDPHVTERHFSLLTSLQAGVTEEVEVISLQGIHPRMNHDPAVHIPATSSAQNVTANMLVIKDKPSGRDKPRRLVGREETYVVAKNHDARFNTHGTRRQVIGDYRLPTTMKVSSNIGSWPPIEGRLSQCSW